MVSTGSQKKRTDSGNGCAINTDRRGGRGTVMVNNDPVSETEGRRESGQLMEEGGKKERVDKSQ